MKIFEDATFKLTVIYTTIVMVFVIIFSSVIAWMTLSEIRRPAEMPTIFNQLRVDSDFLAAYQARAAQLESTVWFGLILINISTLILSAVSSHYLAKSTLRPIEKALQDEAQFVSDASHELRTPLANILMENEVLLRDNQASSQELRDQIASNIEEIEKLRKMTDSLLKMCSSQEISIQKQDVSTIVNTAIGRVERLAEGKSIKIDNTIKDFQLTCNADALTEILYVYLENAIKYSPEKSTITVRRHGANGIAVSDQGQGIAEKDIKNIFKRFYRADESRNSEGFGLGLSLASRLANRTGAKLSVHNNKGKGATFVVIAKPKG